MEFLSRFFSSSPKDATAYPSKAAWFQRLAKGEGQVPPTPTSAPPLDETARRVRIQQAQLLLDSYTAYIKQGKIPGNDELLDGLDRAEDVILDLLQTQADQLSHASRVLWSDIQHWIYVTRIMLLEKNPDEAIQHFFHHIKAIAATSSLLESGGTTTPANVQDQGPSLMSQITGFLRACLISRKFRTFLLDLTELGNDAIGHLKQGITEASSEEARMAGGELVMKEQELEEGHPKETVLPPKAPIRPDLQELLEHRPFGWKAHAKETIISSPSVRFTAERTAKDTVIAPTEIEEKRLLEELEEPIGTDADSKVFETAKQVKSDVFNILAKGKATLLPSRQVQDYFSAEGRRILILRFLKLISHGKKDVDAMNALKLIHGGMKRLIGLEQMIDPNDRVQISAYIEFKKVLDRLTGVKDSIEPMMKSAASFHHSLTTDANLRRCFRNFVEFFGFCMEHFIDDACIARGEIILHELQHHLKEHYTPESVTLARQAGDVYRLLQQDLLCQAIQKRTTQVWEDLTGSTPNGMLNMAIVRDVLYVLAPMVARRLQVIPIPMIELDTEDLYFQLRDVILTSEKCMPNVVQMSMSNGILLALHSTLQTQSTNTLTIGLYQIQVDMKNAPYEFAKKRGLIRMVDSGKLDLQIGKGGVSIQAKVRVDIKRPEQVFSVVWSRVKVDELSFRVWESRHSGLIMFFRPLIQPVIKSQIEKAIQNEIEKAVTKANEQMARKPSGVGSVKGEGGLISHPIDWILKSLGLAAPGNKVEDEEEDGMLESRGINDDDGRVQGGAYIVAPTDSERRAYVDARRSLRRRLSRRSRSSLSIAT